MILRGSRPRVGLLLAVLSALGLLAGCGLDSQGTFSIGPDSLDGGGDTTVPTGTPDGGRDVLAPHEGGGDATPPLPDGQAGCQKPTDCPAGQACNPATHTCGASCSNPTVACNGGCCGADNQCHGGASDGTACGNTGGACAVCSGATPVCAAGACVALCNPPCMANECCANGACKDGTQPTTCGVSSMQCIDCAGSAGGTACLAGGTCGCKQASDCPQGHACMSGVCSKSCTGTGAGVCNGGCCDNGTCFAGVAADRCRDDGQSCTACPSQQACTPGSTGGSCSGACSAATSPCQGGCCDGAQCRAGTDPNACGKGGTMCAAPCAGLVPFCILGVCAQCNQAKDCPSGQACNAVGTCGTACSVPNFPCSDGCCNNGSCTAGTQDMTCGGGGGRCTDCTSNTNGKTHCCSNSNSCDDPGGC